MCFTFFRRHMFASGHILFINKANGSRRQPNNTKSLLFFSSPKFNSTDSGKFATPSPIQMMQQIRLHEKPHVTVQVLFVQHHKQPGKRESLLVESVSTWSGRKNFRSGVCGKEFHSPRRAVRRIHLYVCQLRWICTCI